MKEAHAFAISLLIVIGATSASCTKGSTTDGTTPGTTASTTAPPLATNPARGCVGLDKTACVLRRGCILDQPAAGQLVCRAGRNACELAVRHADIIGHDVKGVTDADQQAAMAKCTATAGCVVGGGKCSCTCAIFGNCNCACGGGWLARCTSDAEATALDGFPGRAP